MTMKIGTTTFDLARFAMNAETTMPAAALENFATQVKGNTLPAGFKKVEEKNFDKKLKGKADDDVKGWLKADERVRVYEGVLMAGTKDVYVVAHGAKGSTTATYLAYSHKGELLGTTGPVPLWKGTTPVEG